MPRLWFHPPVNVATQKPGRIVSVSSVERAAEQLLEWPRRGPDWQSAVKTCMSAMEGKASAEEARAAFRRAAEEAGMLVGS
jgi:hypothetical protein